MHLPLTVPRLHLLGPPSACVGEGRVDLAPDLTLWLVTLLACHEEPLTRAEVLALLYPGVAGGAARNRLRNLLHRARQLPWASALDAGGETLRWSGAADVRELRRAAEAGAWAGALAAGGAGEGLLGGLRPAGLDALDDWLAAERAALQALWRDAARGRAAELDRGGDPRGALALFDRVLEASPTDEAALHGALRVAGRLRDPAAASARYARFRAALGRDLGAAPGAATARLYQEVLRGAQLAPPTSAGPLYGREAELGGVCARLAGPGGLLTLVGPGGAGKTRLAREALARTGSQGPVVWAALEGVTTLEAALSHLAAALGLGVGGRESPEAQLLAALQAGRPLLVLDNLEPMLQAARPEVLGLLSRLLAGAPGLRLLVTSRLRLGLREEEVVALGGLDAPRGPAPDDLARSGAAQLFVARARMVRPDFALPAAHGPLLVRLCALLGGLPLALELAASALGTLDLPDLVAELEQDLDAAGGGAPDRPERHRSLRAAFASSWRLLDPAGQALLARLSVFAGGFGRASALEVGGARLPTLLALGDHSLLRRLDEGRYDLHAALRPYAAEQLSARPAEAEATRRAHAAHHAALAREAAPHLHGPRQATWLARLDTEHPNLRLAVAWTLAHDDADAALGLCGALHWFWYVRGHHREGLRALRAALARPGGLPQARARALGQAGGLARELGESAQARALLNEGLALAMGGGAGRDGALEAEVRYALGQLEREQGHLEAARAQLQAAERLQRAAGERWGLSTTLNDLGIVAATGGDLGSARALFQESLDLKQALGDRQGVAYALANLGNATEDLETFEALTRQSLEIKRELGDRQGVANALYNLAGLALDRGEPLAARAALEEALTLFWHLGRGRGVGMTLTAFARLAVAEGQPGAALTLAGAAEGQLRAAGAALQGVDIGPAITAARQAEGAGAEALYLRGLHLPPGAAVALALGRPPAADPPPA